MNIPTSLGSAAGVAVSPVNASATVAAGGSGGQSVFAGLVIADKGQPFKLLRVTKANWRNLLGRPLRPTAGKHAGSLRCMEDALKGGDGYTVRVVPKTAKFPVITVRAVEIETGKNTTTATALSFGSKVELSVGDLMALYPTDGNVELRSISLIPNQNEAGVFTLSSFITDPVSGEQLEKSWKVSTNRNAVDDDGKSLFITDVLARTSAFINCVVSDANLQSVIAAVEKTPFVGATNGQFADITQEDWAKGAAILSNAMVGYTAVVGLGITNPAVTALLADIAAARRIDAFADVEADNYAGAISAVKAMGFNYENLCLYFFPFKCRDDHYGVHAHWGISGVAFAAKAAGVAKAEGSTGGWHYSPAGVERGIISRKEPLPFDGLDEADEEAMYKARLNKLGLSSGGLLMIDDAITTRQKDDLLVFQHVGSVMNAITREYYAMAKNLQHEPDGVTEDGLSKGLRNIFDNYVAAQALVVPSDPDNGEEPYVFEIKKAEFDMWTASWSCCVTGTSRRILGIPALFK